MAPLPFIGRLNPHEYLALALSFTLALLELFIRTVTLLLPTPIFHFLYRASRGTFNYLSRPSSRRARNKKKSVSTPIAEASDFVELCGIFGYKVEEHVVQTKDGYLLGLHRLGWRRGEEDTRVNAGPNSLSKRVCYLHHGLLMNSEVWVCLTEKERSLPFTLVDQGYDIWLGNNRGNKYSKKHLTYPPTSTHFWNFSMDQFAFYDIPDSINYVLTTTQQKSLSYIGFSQGTAQAFATLSIHPSLNEKVNLFVALAPAMAPPGLASGIVSSLVKTNPEILFLLFGRRAILSSTTMWSQLLYPAIFAWFIDKSLSFLFGWQTRNISPHQKLAAYPHLYSFTATKTVVHWFQIIRNSTFQMFDDEVVTPLSLSQGSKYYKVAKFPTKNIRTPIVLVYGGSDSLVDIKLMLRELPRHTIARCVPKYEHLDLLWASDVDRLVFPHVLEALQGVAVRESGVKRLEGRRPNLLTLTNGEDDASRPPRHSEDEDTAVSEEVDGALTATPAKRSRHQRHSSSNGIEMTQQEQLDESDYEDDDSLEKLALTPQAAISTSPLPHRRKGMDALQAEHPLRPSAGPRSTSATTITTNASTIVPTTTQPSSHHRRVSPFERVRQEHNRRSQVSENSEGQVTVIADEQFNGAGESVHEVASGEKKVGPEGRWSSTSSLGVEAGQQRGGMMLNGSGAGREQG